MVGWGAKGFYIDTKAFSDMKATTVAQAIIGDDAVMHFAAVGNIDEIETERLRLTSVEYETLVSHFLASLQSYDAIPNAGYTTSDAFFPAKGHFNIFITCNVWLAHVLKESGIRFVSWTPIPLSVSLSHSVFQAE